MKKLLILIVAFFSFSFLWADEGMWLPYSLNGKNLAEMQALGCKLSMQDIFDLNNPSLKDAIVQFGGGCTGELISPQGLLLTNHHCGIGQVQAHSSIDHDYLTDGFWAYSHEEELPNDGLTVSFLAYVEDVTDAVLADVTDGTDAEKRYSLVRNAIKNITEEREGARRVEIVPFYNGNQYILFEYDVYKDVRLVACPPWGIGKYGADTDNWTWPRHKGDFCIFRVYTAPDGSPVEYAAENIPMVSKHFLPISLKGVKEGDYAMILGYPGSTDRYSSSQSVKLIIEQEGPALIKCRTTKLDIYRSYMDEDPEVFIKYASKQASVSNYWKYYIGQVKQLKRNKVVEKKQSLENEFASWINADPLRLAQYGSVLSDFENVYKVSSKYQKAITYHVEAGIRGGEAITLADYFRSANKAIENKSDEETVRNAVNRLLPRVETYFKNYNIALDKDVTIALLNIFYQDIPTNQRPQMLTEQGLMAGGDFTAFVNKAFDKSIFTSQERMNKWLEKPKSLSKDPLFAMVMSMRESFAALYGEQQNILLVGNEASRKYMNGLMQMQKDVKTFYPDANFTMRLTYGSVQGYKSADAVKCRYYTTIDGVMEKYIPDNWEFDVPDKMIELYDSKDYGRYANEDGTIVVNFITTNDITGGNSGSPVIDGEGNLIGLAFDGNWEAMSGDISFEQKVQRTICVDARYLLFVIDKIGNAQNLINEMKIIR